MSRYKDRIAAGRCGKCNEQREAGEKAMCQACREKERDRATARRERSKVNGMCTSCGSRPKVADRSRCETCLRGSAASTRRCARQRKREGLCTACGGPPMPGKTVCRSCSDKATQIAMVIYTRRRAEGKCRHCEDAPIPGRVLCRKHLTRKKQYRADQKREVFEAYGGPQCAHCPEADLRYLEIDHIDGGGRQHMREVTGGSGTAFYCWLKANNFPPGFRVLCRTCNNKAHVERCRKAGTDLTGNPSTQPSHPSPE